MIPHWLMTGGRQIDNRQASMNHHGTKGILAVEMFNSVTIWATMPKSMEHLRGGYIGQVPFDP
jgi:hypothetical protein